MSLALEGVRALLAELGARPLAVGGREALALAEAGGAWWIEAGRLEVFAVGAARDGLEARRFPVATFEPGDLVCGLRVGQLAGALGLDVARTGGTAGLELLAVPHPDTRLLALSAEDLRRWGRQPGAAAELLGLLEAWPRRLLGGLLEERPPRRARGLEAGAEVNAEAEAEPLRAAAGLVWVRHVEGRSRFLGLPELEVEAGEELVPLTEASWLIAEPGTRLSTVTSRLLVPSGGLWQGLASFHALFLRYVALRQREARALEAATAGRGLEIEARQVGDAYRELASVMRQPEASRHTPAAFEDPLLAACQWVGRAQSIEIRRPSTDGSGRLERRLARIAEASRVRHRRVVLRGDWWRQDNGPLVAARRAGEGQDLQPVALLEEPGGGYRLLDPAAPGSSREVDEAVAAELEGAAYMFYAPLPERALGALDLLRLTVAGRRRDLVSLLGLGAASGLLALLLPVLSGYVFARVIPAADRSILAQMVGALLLGALASAGFQLTRSIALLRLAGKFDGILQAAVWDRLLRLPVAFFRRFTVGDLAERAQGIEAIRDLLAGHVVGALLAAVFSLFSFALLFAYDRRLAAVASLLVLLLGALSLGLAAWQLRYQRRNLEERGQVASLLLGLMRGIAKLHTAGAGQRAFAVWATRFARQRRAGYKAQAIANLQAAFSAGYGLLTSITLYAVVDLSVESGLSVSDFLAFNAAFGQFQAAALAALAIVPTVLATIPTYERLAPILVASPEVEESRPDVAELVGDLEISHVSFRYGNQGPLVLDDVSLRARPGEMVALVGASGSGKSTCLRLILGFERPEAGSIYFDGQELSSLDAQSLRRQLGVVLQNGRPMAGDLFTNIVGSRDLTVDDAWEAARLAGLDEDIRRMPMGLHTVVSEGAGTFSGGQVQRLMIARALVHRPRLLFFDEATSALDNPTQEQVSRSLERLNVTRLVIAHRLSTIANADRIYVLDKGRVVEVGRYEELLAQGGVFARLARRQLV
jgi:NHLM bacteriocin system ABC transporter ATP-binding protein